MDKYFFYDPNTNENHLFNSEEKRNEVLLQYIAETYYDDAEWLSEGEIENIQIGIITNQLNYCDKKQDYELSNLPN